IHYYCAPCIDDFLDTIPADMPKSDIFNLLAHHIDREIHRHYRLYPSNYIALDELRGSQAFASKYTEIEKRHFEQYLADQLAKVQLPHKDEPYLREQMLTMYANPAINHMAAKQV
ncbi:MAG: acyltransferase, partial [Prevotella sp.]